jgi:maleylacetate reductase
VPRVLFGRGAISRIGAEAEALGQRILFVCTPSLKNSASAQQVRDSLGAGLVAEFNDVEPHVPREAVDAARRLAAEKNVDVVVALGGGSAIGVGKGVAVIPRPDPPPQGGREIHGSPALIAIPTTYAGSEMTPVVGITDRREGRKRVERNPTALPRLAIYDPEVTVELPPELTASTAMNALAHCVEAVYARDANPVVPPIALDGIRRIVRSLPLCVADGRDLGAREELLLGAYLAAFSIANARMALHHAICHVLGGRTGVSHGVLNAIVLPHVMQFNADAVPDAMTAIADAMQAGARTRDIGAAARATAALLESLPLPKRLRQAGVKEEILEPAAAEVAAGDTAQANPKPVDQADVLQVLRSAW